MEREYIHIHKGTSEQVKQNDKVYCGELFEDCKKGALPFNKAETIATCPGCLLKYGKLKTLQGRQIKGPGIGVPGPHHEQKRNTRKGI